MYKPLCFIWIGAQRFNQLLYARIQKDVTCLWIVQYLLHPRLVSRRRLPRVGAAAYLQVSASTACIVSLW